MRWAQTLSIVAFLVVLVAPPALASHDVEWGFGSSQGPKELTTSEPVTVAVLVTLNGEPIPGFSAGIQVRKPDNPNATFYFDFVTSPDGTASVTFDPPPPGETWTVEYCDADGCLPYGLAMVTGAAVTTTSTSTPTTTTTTTTTTIPEETTTSTPPPETTDPPETTTELPPETTEPPETTTTEATPPTSVVIVDDEGTSWVAWWVIGGILILVGGGTWFFAWWRDPCLEEKARWAKARKACEDARRYAAERQKPCDEAQRSLQEAQDEVKRWQAQVDALGVELAQLEGALGSYVEDERIRYHRIPEGLVTSDGLESLISAKQDQIRSAEDAVRGANESVELWQKWAKRLCEEAAAAKKKADEACAEAERARRAYEDCIQAKSGDAGGATGGGAGTTGGEPTGGGTAPGGGTTPGGPGGTPPPGTTPGGPGGTPPPGTTPGPGGTGVPPPPVTGGGGGRPASRVCTEGDTREEVLERKQFVVGSTSANLEISLEPGVEEFDEWLEEIVQKAGRFPTVRLADPGLSGEIASRLSDLDTSYGVAHTFTIRIPVRRFTMTCVQHWVCRNGSWVKAHKEARQVSVEDINPIVISSATGGPKLTSGDVTRLVRQAQARWRQLERVDAELRAFCGGG